MPIQQIATRDFRHLIVAGNVRAVIAVGLPGAWAVDVVCTDPDDVAVTIEDPFERAQPHARYWRSLDSVDQYLSALGVTEYAVDRFEYRPELPRIAEDTDYFPDGPVEFLDHELMKYVRRKTAG